MIYLINILYIYYGYNICNRYEIMLVELLVLYLWTVFNKN